LKAFTVHTSNLESTRATQCVVHIEWHTVEVAL